MKNNMIKLASAIALANNSDKNERDRALIVVEKYVRAVADIADPSAKPSSYAIKKAKVAMATLNEMAKNFGIAPIFEEVPNTSFGLISAASRFVLQMAAVKAERTNHTNNRMRMVG